MEIEENQNTRDYSQTHKRLSRGADPDIVFWCDKNMKESIN